MAVTRWTRGRVNRSPWCRAVPRSPDARWVVVETSSGGYVRYLKGERRVRRRRRVRAWAASLVFAGGWGLHARAPSCLVVTPTPSSLLSSVTCLIRRKSPHGSGRVDRNDKPDLPKIKIPYTQNAESIGWSTAIVASRMANRKRGASMETPDVVMEAPPLPPMSWDERRRLVYDILNLAPPDVPGVLLLIHGHGTAGMTYTEYPVDGITSWDADADVKGVDRLPQTRSTPTQVDCTFLLDSADQELLHQLREYVDDCYIPHYVPKENCMICEGLWSNGRVIACGNDDCDTRIHEECFGTILREDLDGPWLCPTCLLGRQLNCAVCMQSGGALKPLAAGSNTKDASDDQKWVHVLCALAIPELTMRDVPTLEPVDGFDEIENGRFRYLCGICRKRGGASIICEQENCNVGMHPICAANAGFMIGTEAKPLGAYCEKHLPTSRIAHAKRWISDVDLVEEIMSENSVIEDGDDVTGHGLERFSFILESTPGLHAQNKLLGPASALRWGALPRYSTRPDRKSNAFENVKVNANAWTVPGMVVMGLKTQKPLVFPPQDQDRVGLPAFPQGDDLVGAVVDYLVKDQDEWCRAQIVEWDSGRGLHLLQLIANSQKLWARLGSSNTQILYLMDEENELDGPRIKLYRPVRRGVSEWRPKPRKFASATSS